MKQSMVCLTDWQVKQVSGAGWASWIIPVVSGFIFGGPAGVAVVAGTYIATKGIDNLEHLHKHGDVPTLGEMLNGK